MLQTTAQNLQSFVEHALSIHNRKAEIIESQDNWKCSFKTQGNRTHPLFVKGDSTLWITLRNDKVYNLLVTLSTLGVDVDKQLSGLRDSFKDKYTRYILALPEDMSWRLCQTLTCIIEQSCQAVESE